MTDKKDTPRSASISKAPPPISPLRGSRYIAPASPPVPPPNWGKWAYMRDIEVWEAAALSLNLDPDNLNERHIYLGAYDKFGDDPFRICPPPFLDRLQVACSNCGTGYAVRMVHSLRARYLVDLPAFAAWCIRSKLQDLPPELVAMAATEPTAAPIAAPANETATPAPVIAADPAPDPERRLTLLRTLGGTAKYKNSDWRFTCIAKLVQSEIAAGRTRTDVKTIRSDLKEAAQSERDARSAGHFDGMGQR